MRRPLRLTAVAACVLAAVLAPASAAARDGDPIVVTPGDPDARYRPPTVELGVTDPGQPAGAASRQPSAGGGSGCRWAAQPQMEAWLRRLPSRLPAPGPDRVDPRARLLARICGGVVTGYAWSSPAATAAAAPPSPARLARDAYALLRLPLPAPGRSPDLRLSDGRPAVLVGEHTWVWTDRSAFAPRSRWLQVGAGVGAGDRVAGRVGVRPRRRRAVGGVCRARHAVRPGPGRGARGVAHL